jgi:ATP-dependent protease ClpP protease subunit
MSVLVQGSTIYLYGDVGDFGGSEFFSPSDVVLALGQVGRSKPVTVSLNSGGGDAMDGLTIYNLLSGHQGSVTIEVDGIAASAASLIAMAGDQVVMKAGSLMMIHDPRGVTFGTSDDHDKTSEALDKMGEQYASVYAGKSGKSVADIRTLMKSEIWLTAREAVAGGFADDAEEAPARMAAKFDYRLYARAPRELNGRTTPTLRVDLAADMRRRHSVDATTSSIRDEPGLRVDIVAQARRAQASREEKRTEEKIARDTTLKVDLAADMRRRCQ